MSRHLGAQVSAYVDRRMHPAALLAFDRHVLVCPGCRYAVDQERRLLGSLRSAPGPGVSSGLHSMLLGLAESVVAEDIGRSASGPALPVAPDAVRAMRLPTIPPTAPAQHRSVRRAAFLAGFAAGASAAAAWSLTVAAPGTLASASTSAPTAPTVVRSGFVSSNVLSFNLGPAGPAPTVTDADLRQSSGR
jgi:hypothetical protein